MLVQVGLELVPENYHRVLMNLHFVNVSDIIDGIDRDGVGNEIFGLLKDANTVVSTGSLDDHLEQQRLCLDNLHQLLLQKLAHLMLLPIVFDVAFNVLHEVVEPSNGCQVLKASVIDPNSGLVLHVRLLDSGVNLQGELNVVDHVLDGDRRRPKLDVVDVVARLSIQMLHRDQVQLLPLAFATVVVIVDLRDLEEKRHFPCVLRDAELADQVSSRLIGFDVVVDEFISTIPLSCSTALIIYTLLFNGVLTEYVVVSIDDLGVLVNDKAVDCATPVHFNLDCCLHVPLSMQLMEGQFGQCLGDCLLLVAWVGDRDSVTLLAGHDRLHHFNREVTLVLPDEELAKHVPHVLQGHSDQETTDKRLQLDERQHVHVGCSFLHFLSLGVVGRVVKLVDYDHFGLLFFITSIMCFRLSNDKLFDFLVLQVSFSEDLTCLPLDLLLELLLGKILRRHKGGIPPNSFLNQRVSLQDDFLIFTAVLRCTFRVTVAHGLVFALELK